MNIKKVIILIVIFILTLLFSSLLSYFILNHDKMIKPQSNNTITIGNYSLKYGNYVGYEEEYDYDNDKVEKKKKTILFTKDKINNDAYKINGNKLQVNGFDLYEVVANNKFILLAGEGVEFNYEEK